jgi:phage terminase large subunit-like protein
MNWNSAVPVELAQSSLAAPADLWAPRHYVESRSPETLGPNITDFANLLLKASRGFKAGQPLDFADWQNWLLDRLFELDPESMKLRYRRAVIGLPRKNGKSLLGTTIALEHLLYGPPGAQVYSAASDRNQASIVFSEAAQQVQNSPTLSKHIKVYKTALEVPSRNAVYKALSADAMRAHGLGPSLVIADELHAWPSTPTNKRGDELWQALTEGSGDRPESMVIAITTAGDNPDTLLGRLYEYGIRVASGEIDDPSFGFWWWESPDDADPMDEKTWFQANPNLAEGLLDIDDFRASIRSAGTSGFNSFLRYRLNKWVRTAGEDFVSPHFWGEAERETRIPAGAKITAGFDGSISGDATGIVIQDMATGTIEVWAAWEPDPMDPDWSVDRDEVNEAIHKLFQAYDVVMLWCDPSFFETDVLNWSKLYKNRVERIPPTNNRMSPLAQQWLSDLISGDIGHVGDPRLTRHVRNAVATESGSFRKEKRSSPRKVDLLACAILANGAAHANRDKLESKARRAIIL